MVPSHQAGDDSAWQRLCRKLVEAEQKYNAVTDSMQEAAAEYREVLSQYDLEFEEKGQQMSDKLQKV